MDRRAQRLLLLVLFFGVAVVLYRTLASPENTWSTGHTFGSNPEDNTVLRADVAKLEAANSTLGVGQAVERR